MLQATSLEVSDFKRDAQTAHVSSSGATVSAADTFHAVRPPGLEIKARLAGIQVRRLQLLLSPASFCWLVHLLLRAHVRKSPLGLLMNNCMRLCRQSPVRFTSLHL